MSTATAHASVRFCFPARWCGRFWTAQTRRVVKPQPGFRTDDGMPRTPALENKGKGR